MADEEDQPKYILITENREKKNISREYAGKGTAYYPNGDIYEGDFQDGIREGRGKYFYASNGDKYDGEWKQNFKHGIGQMAYNGKGDYNGYWENGRRHGEGVFTYPNGDKYSGWWKFGDKEGTGTYVFKATGMKLFGQWKQSNIESGRWIYPNGMYYEGTFENNKPSGKGKWVFKNGNQLTGNYEQKKKGEDEEAVSNVNVIVFVYVYDQLQSRGWVLNTNNSILDVSRDLRIGQETTFHNQNDYTPNSPTSQISALTRYEQNTTQGAPIINPKRMQIIRKKKTVSIGAGIEPNSRDIEQNISENLQDKPQLQKSPTNDEIDSLTKNFINSADFVSQQLEFRCERTLLEAKWVLVSSYIMMIFPICMIVYQLFLLITIQKQVQLIQENTNDDEGNPIDIKLSYPLFIVSILFTLFSNILIFSIGLFGRKVFPQNIKAIQILVQNNFEQLKLEQRYQIYTKKFFNYTVILIIAIGLLTTCQIGINFINIEKAQSEYVKQHRLSHVLSDNFLSKNEIKTINTLKQGYEFSYLGIAAFELIFFLLFLCNLIKFKANQLKLENQTITFNYMLKGQSYFEEVEENPEQNQNSFQLQANEIKFFNKQENNTSPHKNNVYQNVQQQSNPNTTQISNRNINTTQINQQSQNGPNLNPQNPLAIQILNQTKQNSSSFTKLQKKVLGSLSSHNRNQQAQNIQRTKKVDKSKQEYSYQSQDDQEIDLDFYESQNSNSKREQNIDDLNYAAQGIKFISKNQNKSKQDTQEQQYIKRKNYYLQNSSNYNSQNQD